MSDSVKSTDSVDTMVFAPPTLSPPPTLLKTIRLNTHINPIDTSTTAICPSPARSRHSINNQSDGQDDPHSPTLSHSPENGSPSPGSQGHPPPVASSLPATPNPLHWSPTPTIPKLQRANSNPTAGTPILSPTPLRRRQSSASSSSSSSSPPSKLQTIPIEPLRRQGSGAADLSPIDECRVSECDGKRKKRLEKEARELAKLQAQVHFFSDGSDDDEVDKEEDGRARDDSVSHGQEEEVVGSADGTTPEDKEVKKKTGGAKNNKLHNCIKLAREKSYGRVFDDPFSAAAVLLVLPFCPPLSVYLTFRECGGLNRHRARGVGIAVLLTILGWVPGIVYALVVYFRHLPRPPDPQENQALHLSPRQKSGQCSDKLSQGTLSP
ncbi:hypothetical protein NKR19_g9705 [Coniochaeta hoffmannii]|uniref:Uncharacterized protein n=1 Tax=Coniochaeta hoffmannii TaxID=91930 RepID=A0AA38VG70_9PEZI|nr:hypothetical protein NKR19_g9705 [Coniochaeta hoffmannii]